MDGIHDMGGMHGMGPVQTEEDPELFHAEWEKRIFAINNAIGPLKFRNIDESRHGRERMNPAEYLASSYYQIWYDGLVRIMTEKGILTPGELAGTAPLAPVTRSLGPKMTADAVDQIMSRGGSYKIEGDEAAKHPPLFKVGDKVRGRNIHPTGHTRLPRYARGKAGQIIADYGVHVFPDANAHGPDRPQHLYNVRFSSRELWGLDGNDQDYVSLDLWDDHLEAVT
jgi:nitrile hydratase subunit beta